MHVCRRDTFGRWALALGLLVAAGCAGSEELGPRRAAEELRSALVSGDSTAACEALAPDTRHRMVENAQEPCTSAITEEQLPHPGAVTDIDVFGTHALVRLEGDTYFVADVDGWRVVAAGCRAQAQKPYECQVEGA